VAVQDLGPEPHRLERAGAEILDQHARAAGEAEQQFAPARLAQGKRQALLVARIELPMDADAVRLPGAQRVAPLRVLDLDHLGAEIGQLQADHVAGNQPRQVDDPDPVERAGRLRGERRFGKAHRRVSGAAQAPEHLIAGGAGNKRAGRKGLDTVHRAN
jgi:hypothetical protein